MGTPGVPGSALPADISTLPRKLRDLERSAMEDRASVAQSFGPVMADLAAKDVILEAQTAALAAQTAALAAQDVVIAGQVAALAAANAYQASLISRDASVATFNTGTLVNDSAWHLVGAQAIIENLPIPTGKVRVTVSLSEASISPGLNSVIAAICFAVDSVSAISPTSQYARVYVSAMSFGTSLSRTETVTLPPGAHTIRAQCAYWSAGSSVASINFTALRIMAQVVGSD